MISTESQLYRILVWSAVGIGIFIVASMVYEYMGVADEPGVLHYRRGNLRLEDGKFSEALVEFNGFLEIHQDESIGYLGRALALMGMGDNKQALDAFNTAIGLDDKMGAAFANRGILHDRMGRHKEAMEDYRKALQLDVELSEGPGWFTRFFRSQWEKPPTIADRLAFLEKEMAKPPQERVLQVPEVDSKQRSYKLEK